MTHSQPEELSLESILAHAEDPLLLVRDGDTVIWRNMAAERLLPMLASLPVSLSEVIGAESAKSIAQARHFTCADVEVRALGAVNLSQSAIAIDVGSGAPEHSLTLVGLKSLVSGSKRVSEQHEFLAAIAHDLKNPLSAIFGYGDALLDTGLGASMNPAQREIVSRMRVTAGRSLELLKNFQYISQLQSSKAHLPPMPVDLNAVVASAVGYIWRDDANGPALSMELAPGQLVTKAERVQLDRVSSNLLSNALKYTPPSGKVAVRTGRDGETVWLAVFNSEPHINADELPFIFDRYRRASSSKGTSGSGLGLHIVKTIVQDLGGTVSVLSAEGEGTTFTVRLPAIDEEVPAPPRSPRAERR